MDEQEKEIEEILRTFDKAPSPSSENSVQNQAQQNNKQPRQISQKPTDTERIARTSNQTEYKRQAQSSKGRYLSPTRKTAIKRRKRQRAVIVSLLALLFVVLIIVLICKGCSGRTDALAGKWDFDGTTAYEFDGKGSGALLLTLADYDFTYEIKDNQLYIDFVNESAHDATYEFSVKGDTLILIGGEGTIGGTYELTKVHDKKADK